MLSRFLDQVWSRDLGAPVSYPLVVNGRVFVAVAQPVGGFYGAQLYAIAEHTGEVLWGPVPLPGTYSINSIAADGANVYSVNFDGLLRAFDQTTGAQVWQSPMPGQYAFTSPPSTSGGTIFVGGAGSGGTLYAVNAADGSVLWTAAVENGDHSSPAVTVDGVYVSYACEVAYRFDPTSSHNIWTHTTGCEGGGGRTSVVHGDRLYVRDDGNATTPTILRTIDGLMVDSFQSFTAPAFDGNLAFYATGDPFSGGGLTLTAVDLTTGTVKWSQSGDGRLSTAPLIVDGKVIMGSFSGMVALFDEITGSPLWSANAGASVDFPDEHNARMLVGLAESDGMLFVPATNRLVAYAASTSTPTSTPTNMASATSTPSVTASATSTASVAATATSRPQMSLGAVGGVTDVELSRVAARSLRDSPSSRGPSSEAIAFIGAVTATTLMMTFIVWPRRRRSPR